MLFLFCFYVTTQVCWYPFNVLIDYACKLQLTLSWISVGSRISLIYLFLGGGMRWYPNIKIMTCNMLFMGPLIPEYVWMKELIFAWATACFVSSSKDMHFQGSGKSFEIALSLNRNSWWLGLVERIFKIISKWLPRCCMPSCVNTVLS